VQAQQGTLAYFDVQVKNHPLHRPMQKYLSDKLDKKNEAIVEANKSKEGMRAEGDKWVGDLRKVRELIRRIQHKVFVCAQCKQKFLNYNLLEIHEKMSEVHRLNGLKGGDGLKGGEVVSSSAINQPLFTFSLTENSGNVQYPPLPPLPPEDDDQG